MPGPLAVFLPSIIGGVRGAIRPPPGLSNTQGFVHGFANGLPGYRLGGTIAHIINGTTGQWSDPANNPFNNPGNFGGIQPGAGSYTAPTAPGAIPAGPGAFANDPTDPNNPGAYQLNPPGGPASSGNVAGRMSPADFLNQWRSPFSQTYQQAVNPGSAIGPVGGGITNPYDPNASRAPSGHDSSMGALASALRSWIMSRNQI